MKFAVALALAATSVSASAETWVHFGVRDEAPKRSFPAIDVSSVQQTGDTITAITAIGYEELRPDGARFLVGQSEYNCAERTTVRLYVGARDSSGSEMRWGYTENEGFKPVPEGSIGDMYLRAVCNQTWLAEKKAKPSMTLPQLAATVFK